MNSDDNNEKSKSTKNEKYSNTNDEIIKHKDIDSLENNGNQNITYGSERRKIFLQFSEPVSKQVYNTNSGYYDEICLRRPIITMTFTDAISKKTTIYIRMFDSLTNKLIAELPLPINIIPFDKKVSSKFRMINKFDENPTKNADSLLGQQPLNNLKDDNNKNLMLKGENESENHFIDFDVFENGNVNTDTNDNLNIPRNNKIKKNVPKIKLFLLIHLSTFGQLPFHAQKGTLLKRLKDATRIKAKSFGNKKDSKDKSLSLNSIITPLQRTSTHDISSISSFNPTSNQQKIQKVYDFDIFNSDRANSNLKMNPNSNTSSEYTESNDSSSEVVETLFVDNFSDQKDQQQNETENKNQQTDVFIDNIPKTSHNHHHTHHRHHHRSNGHTHHHSHQHHHSSRSNQLDQQKNLSDDQNEVSSYSNFNGKTHKKALLKVGSCGDIPTQCLLTDILVK